MSTFIKRLVEHTRKYPDDKIIGFLQPDLEAAITMDFCFINSNGVAYQLGLTTGVDGKPRTVRGPTPLPEA